MSARRQPRAAVYRQLDEALAAVRDGESFKAFDDLMFDRPEVLGIWIACTLPSMTDAQLAFFAARVPPLFAAISSERARRRTMDGAP